MFPTSQDEPALQVALVQALVKLIVGMPVAGGFILRNNLSAALAVFVAAFLASGWSVVQGYLTRSKVYAPATVKAAPTVALTGVQGGTTSTGTDWHYPVTQQVDLQGELSRQQAQAAFQRQQVE